MASSLDLAALADALRASSGLAAKRDIGAVAARLGLNGASAVAVGDDCAAIPDGDGFLLLAIEGFMNEFVAGDPWFAGWCGVMVNVSDVVAMGGRPIAVVDALWADGEDKADPCSLACERRPMLSACRLSAATPISGPIADSSRSPSLDAPKAF